MSAQWEVKRMMLINMHDIFFVRTEMVFGQCFHEINQNVYFIFSKCFFFGVIIYVFTIYSLLEYLSSKKNKTQIVDTAKRYLRLNVPIHIFIYLIIVNIYFITIPYKISLI